MVQRSQLADYQRARRLRPKTGPLMGVSDLDTYVDRPLMAELSPAIGLARHPRDRLRSKSIAMSSTKRSPQLRVIGAAGNAAP